MYAALLAGAAVLVLTPGVSVRSHAQTATTPQQPPAAAAKPLTGKALASATCAICHGPDGNSPTDAFPKIAGQKRYYLEMQLWGFKYGARKSDVMTPIAKGLSDAQIASLARFFSRAPVKPDVVKDRKLAAQGARIFHYPSRGVPPCAACHSAAGYGPQMMGGGMMGGGMGGHMGMMGDTGATPRLFGQHATYIVQQLDAFAGGKRRGTVMGPVAARLSPRERQAVADYLAGRR